MDFFLFCPFLFFLVINMNTKLYLKVGFKKKDCKVCGINERQILRVTIMKNKEKLQKCKSYKLLQIKNSTSLFSFPPNIGKKNCYRDQTNKFISPRSLYMLKILLMKTIQCNISIRGLGSPK